MSRLLVKQVLGPPPRASPDHHDAEAVLAGVIGGRIRRVRRQPDAPNSVVGVCPKNRVRAPDSVLKDSDSGR